MLLAWKDSHRDHHRSSPVEGSWKGLERAWDAGSDLDLSLGSILASRQPVGKSVSLHLSFLTCKMGR